MRRSLLGGLGLAAFVACAPHPRPVQRAIAPEIVYVRRAPPAARVEILSPRPGRGYAWVSGNWRWDRDGYFWTQGRWERSPSGRSLWVQGNWQRGDRGWYWTPGHWR